MGWTTYYKRKGQETMREHFQREWGSTNHILESSYVNLSTFYAAVEKRDGLEEGLRVVYGIVVLARHYPMDPWGHNFSVKEIDETMGPNEDECPRRILELLTPTDSEYANQWRERCWENVRKRESRPKVSKGDMVVFNEKLTFSNGATEDHFFWKGGSKFEGGYGNRQRFHITRWRERSYFVVPAAKCVECGAKALLSGIERCPNCSKAWVKAAVNR